MYSKKIIKTGIVLLFLTVMVSALDSCKIMQPYSRPGFISKDSLYRDQSTADTANISTIPWKNLFNDDQLISFIDEALNNNPDIRIAVIRMKKAEAGLRQSTAALELTQVQQYKIQMDLILPGISRYQPIHPGRSIFLAGLEIQGVRASISSFRVMLISVLSEHSLFQMSP